MRIKLSNYISQKLVKSGITRAFSVVGGGAMHLNNALGHEPGLTVTYNHHEQASAIAAECYARINNVPACVCVTTGPGGTNAITGVVGAWLDSIPMFVISGQVRYDTTARFAYKETGAVLRAMGETTEDEIDQICSMIYHHDDKQVIDSPLDEVLKDADVIHHCFNDLSKPVKDKEKARFNALIEELGLATEPLE